MDKKPVEILDFYYFSGTGNTFLVVKAMKEVFEAAHILVRLHPIEQNPSVFLEKNQLIGLGFPVVAFSTFPFVRQFIEKMPHGNGTPIFMVDTLGMISGGMVGPLKRVVKNKGYLPAGAREIKMPENFYPKKVSLENNRKRIEQGLQAARVYAGELLAGTARWQRVPLLPDIIWLLGGTSLLKNFLRKMGEKITVDHEKCTLCGLCVKLCPVANIYQEDETINLHKHCEQCMRCLSFCPENAITVPGKVYIPHKAVEAHDLQGASE